MDVQEPVEDVGCAKGALTASDLRDEGTHAAGGEHPGTLTGDAIQAPAQGYLTLEKEDALVSKNVPGQATEVPRALGSADPESQDGNGVGSLAYVSRLLGMPLDSSPSPPEAEKVEEDMGASSSSQSATQAGGASEAPDAQVEAQAEDGQPTSSHIVESGEEPASATAAAGEDVGATSYRDSPPVQADNDSEISAAATDRLLGQEAGDTGITAASRSSENVEGVEEPHPSAKPRESQRLSKRGPLPLRARRSCQRLVASILLGTAPPETPTGVFGVGIKATALLCQACEWWCYKW